MATIDEILDAMPEEDATTGRDYLVIDPATRTITVPLSEKVFGVEGDEDAARKYFICPRYVGDNLDLASMFLTVYFRTATDYEDGYLVDDVAVNGEYVTFSWLLSSSITEHRGTVQFSVCADLPNSTNRRGPDWNTTIAQGDILEGLDPDVGDVEAETSDVVTQLRAEIAASTAAVEATGAAQVDVVEAAGAAATAAAQKQIEAKGAATLATIPADYTTMAGKVNEQANAIKGHLSGEIIQAGDVSPVGHYLSVKAHGKNLFNTGKFAPAEDQTASIYVSAVEAGTITLYCSAEHNGYYSTGLRLCEVCAGLEAGKTYTLSAATEATGREYMYLHGANVTWWYGKPQTMTEEMLKSTIVLYSINGKNNGAGYCNISNIQLEEGAVATEYTPYIDPAGVTVTRCGKNLINSEIMKEQATLNGVTITRDGDLLTLDGTLTVDSVLFSTSFFLHGVIDKYYALSYKHLGGTVEGTASVCVGTSDTATAARQSWGNVRLYNEDNSYTYQLLRPYIKDFWFYATAGAVFSNYKIKVQLESGQSVTEFEARTSATAMPDESGAVTGLPSAAPTMTLYTDTAGVTIECTYNRDSNAVYAELLAKIAALSG